MNKKSKQLYHVVGMFFLICLGVVGCRETEVGDPTVTLESTPAAQITVPPTAVPTSTALYTPVYETADCAFTPTGAAEIECGYLIVPEDRTNPERMIRLHVALISSNRSDPAPDPVVYLEGGPGGHALDNIPSFVELFQPVLRDRDVIIFDQRGVGYSEPSLNCPEYEAARLAHIEALLDLAQRAMIETEALLACRDRLLSEGIHLAAYNSAANAADLNDLRLALGYESWNLYGVSYGTKLALTTMRDFGSTGAIRSVILDSVYPLEADGFNAMALNANRSFSLLFERCAAIEQCNKDYPDLENRYYQLVDDLNADPITVVVPDRVNRSTYRMPFTGNDLIITVFDMMYADGLIIKIPKMIAQLENGVSMILTDYLIGQVYRPLGMSEGMSRSVQCFEEFPFSTSLEEQANGVVLPEQLIEYFQFQTANISEQCQLWLDETADPIENQPVVSDIPTLILAGDYDPITPPSYGMLVAESLSHSFYFEFLGVGHGVVFSDDCGFELVVDFLTQPNMAPDDSCLEHLFIGFVP